MNYSWQQVKEIFTAALRENTVNRPQFILQQCAGDKVLLREVESLLEFHKNSDSFMAAPAVASVAEDIVVGTDKLKDGDFLKHYRIIRKIGQGGMGEVYLAQDTKLGRNVAIKILGDYLGNNKANLQRFITEAKATSSLNHPNIVVIHEIDENDGINYIVSEYIEGRTLTEILKQNQLTLTQICDISIQTAKALSAAHTVGIIHRDIKTDNVMVREDGIVKVLDFGLAKLVEENKIVTDLSEKIREFMTTRAGMIMGTVAYMSPEQARGQEVDKRSDIWSFGVLLYQLLTRKLPFQGDTSSDIMASILKSEPLPLTENAPNVPKKLEWIVRTALIKKLDERFQNINEVLDELKNFRRGLELGGKTEPINFRVSNQFEQDKETDFTPNKPTAENSEANRKSFFSGKTSSRIGDYFPIPVYALITCAILLAAVYFGWSKIGSYFTKPDSFQNMKLTKLTIDGLPMKWTTVSPDGKYIGYVLQNEKSPSLNIRLTATSSVVELVPPADVEYLGIRFSPDSNFIYYTSKKKNSVGELYKIPALGGRPEKILDDVTSAVTFSPDGTKMAFVHDKNSVMIADPSGESVRLLDPPKPSEYKDKIDWSPDGKTIVSSIFSLADDRFYLTEISVADGNEKRLPTPAWIRINSLQWLADGSGLIFTGRDSETKLSQIWQISYPSAALRRITNDLSTYLDASLSFDNKTLFAIKVERRFNLWLASRDSAQNPKEITTAEERDEGRSGVRWTPDGKIIYSARTTMKTDLWMVDADGGNNHPITSNEGAGSNYFPTVSPDGKYLAFTSDRSGNADIWRTDIDGRNSIKLAGSPNYESWADLSPDGKFLLYERMDAEKNLTIWKLNLEDSSTTQLTQTETDRPVISPDGKFFACQYGKPTAENPAKLAIFSVNGGKPLKVLDLPKVIESRVYRWTPDGKALMYVESRNRVFNIWSQPLDLSPPKQMTFFDSQEIDKFDFSPNNQTFVLSRGNESSDIVVISDFN